MKTSARFLAQKPQEQRALGLLIRIFKELTKRPVWLYLSEYGKESWKMSAENNPDNGS